MNTKIYSFLLLLLFNLHGLKAQNINFSYVNLKNYLLSSSPSNNIAKDSSGNSIAIDTNGDGEISEQEALNVYNLYLNIGKIITENPIFSTEDLKYFSNVQIFKCEGQTYDTNYIRYIDLTKLTKLREIYIQRGYKGNLPTVKFPDIMPELKILHYPFYDWAKVPNLEELDSTEEYLHDVILSESDVKYLKKLRFLGDISIENSPGITDIYIRGGAATLINLPDLVNLDINGENIYLKDLAKVVKLPVLTQGNIYMENMGLEELNYNFDGKNLNNRTTLTIKNLPNLTRINCKNSVLLSNIGQVNINGGIEELSLYDLPKLTFLDCSGNFISSLDLSNSIPNLTSLNCNDNLLTTLNISNNPKLEYLSIVNYFYFSLHIDDKNSENTLEGNLAILDISKNKNLTELSIGGQKITNLDLSNITQLKKLSIVANENLKEIDFSKNTLLESLACYGNPISIFDLSNNPNITNLTLSAPNVYDNRYLIKQLIIKNNITDKWLTDSSSLSLRPNLEGVCCDEAEVELVKSVFSYNDTLSIVTDCKKSLEIEDIKPSLNVSLYPNPVINTLIVNSKDIINKIEILDVNGRLIISQSLTSNKIDVSSLPKGIYYISLYSEKGKNNQKFIKQ